MKREVERKREMGEIGEHCTHPILTILPNMPESDRARPILLLNGSPIDIGISFNSQGFAEFQNGCSEISKVSMPALV